MSANADDDGLLEYPLPLCDQIDGARGGHGSSDRLDASLLREEGNHVSMGSQDGKRVRGSHEEPLAENHVSVRVSICGGAEGRWLRGSRHRVTGFVHPHHVAQIARVGEIGVRVTAVEVVLGDGVQ